MYEAVLEQALGRLRVEARVGAQEVQERGEVALEAGLRDDRVHLGADAQDLLAPDLVDLVGREVERREAPDEVGVVLAAARQGRGGDRGRARRARTRVCHEIEERPVARDGALA